MKKFLCLFVVLLCISMSCEDILEEVDISERQVTLFAPLDNTTVNSNTVNFNWDRVEDASSYRFQLATPNFQETQQLVLDSIFVVDSLNRVATQIQRSLTNGNYQWRIKGMNSGFETSYSSSSFTVNGDADLDITPPNTPQLVAPTNGTSQDANQVTFRWTREDVAGTAERDSIYFFSDEQLMNAIGKDLGANKTFTSNFSSGTYYWVVQAFDGAGNESEISATFNFTIN